MSADFLTDEQKQRYGRYRGEPTDTQLARYFHLDDTDLSIVYKRRGKHNHLGFALQLVTVRFLGTFLSNPVDVPQKVIDHISAQLNIADKKSLSRYMQRRTTHFDHVVEIKKLYGYHNLSDFPWSLRLTRWLYSRVWLSTERPSLLFDLTTAWLVERKVILPGATTLTRLISRVRERVTQRLWQQLSALPNQKQRKQLEDLLKVPKGERYSYFDNLCRGPTRISSPALLGALNRYKEIKDLGIGKLNVSRIPATKLDTLARYAITTWAPNIARMPEQRRIATLVAFAHSLETIALDDALDLLDLLITETVSEAKRDGKKERLRTLGDLDKAALALRNACVILLDSDPKELNVKEIVFSQVGEDNIRHAVSTVEALARPKGEGYRQELVNHYRRIRSFLPELLETVSFQAIPSGQPIFDALKFWLEHYSKDKKHFNKAPLEIVPPSWKRLVIEKDSSVNYAAYTLCLIELFQDALRRRNIFSLASNKWGDTRSKLLQKDFWEKSKGQVCRSLGRELDFGPELKKLSEQLDASYKQATANLPQNTYARIEQRDGRDHLVVSNIDKIEVPPRVTELRKRVAALLPRVDLPELLMEVQMHTGFLEEFSHISESHSRVAELSTSLCAVLIAEACNIGLEPLVSNSQPALTRDRLGWVQQNYIRADTLTKANARLVDFHSKNPLVQAWGSGDIASADGLRFTTSVQTVNSGPNAKYFKAGRGITYYNFTSNQFSGFNGIVIPGVLRDSIFILEGLLEQKTGLKPYEIMADTSGVSDLVFGLFWLLGYQFSPRLADIGSLRFWRIDKLADYGPFNNIARNRVNINRVERNWDDMLRTAGSLKMGTVKASELVRSLLKSNKPSDLAKAIMELGRIPKTIHLLNFTDDVSYRHRIINQLNRGEGRHKVARAICYGQRGEIRKRYRQGQEDQLGALGIVTNAVVLWNALYIDKAIEQLCEEGFEITNEDITRLWPLQHKHINFLGRYFFTLPENISKGKLRPLNDSVD